MKKSALSIEEFKRLIPRVKCINLFHYNLLNTAKLSEVCKVARHCLETPQEINALKDIYLVWYATDTEHRIMWDTPGARNMVLGELAQLYVDQPSYMDDKFKEIVQALKDGKGNAVELIAVHDTVLNATVLVDGVYRALALYYIHLTDPATLQALCESSLSLCTITLTSPAGSLIFPCDFVNLSRDLAPGLKP